VRKVRTVGLVVAAVLLVAACSSSDGTTSSAPTTSAAADPSTDKLAQVQARGTLILPTDPAYPPASFAVKGAERASETLCSENQLTGPEVDGYDVAVSKLVAAALGVEPCFVTPTWTEMIAGNWGDRWDLAFTSIGITYDRMEVLYYTQPYYATPERFYVKDDAPYEEMEDLDGASIGVCAGCFADLYLQKELDIPGAEVTFRVDDADIVAYDVERSGLDDVGAGKLDAFLCQETVGDQAIAEGISLRAIDPAAYEAFIGGAIDRSSGLAVGPFYDRVNEILQGAHADGTLAALSEEYFGTDYATAAGEFDIDALEQEVT
jgi:polar amino acid transport system substrate-binding protein